MNVIIPLGGKGQRFKDQDYRLPKILVPVLGKEIIFWVIESLKITKNDVITIIYNNELENYRLKDRILKKFDHNFHFIKLPFQTSGPVETIMYGLNKLPPNILEDQLILHDGDSFIKKDILSEIKPRENKIFYTFKDDPNPIYSYIKLNKSNEVTEIAEKRKISDNANIGCYVFDSGHTFLKYGEQLKPENGETYVSSVYDKLLKDNVKINSSKVDDKDFICLGTPNQVVDFALHREDIPKTFCFDLDNTLVTYPTIKGDYYTVDPIEKNIKFLKYLKSRGHKIIIYTARRMLTHQSNVGKVIADVGEVTISSLRKFGVPYDEIFFGKPHADFYIDDLMINSFDNLEKETGFYINTVEAREFNNIIFTDDTVAKTSDHGLDGQSYFYQNCPEEIAHYLPKIISANENEIKMERIQGNSFSKMYCHKLLAPKYINRLFEVLDDIHRVKVKTPPKSIYSNYVRKLQNRYMTYDYSQFPNSKELCKKLILKLSQYEIQNLGKLGVVHGDFVFSNIFITNDDKLKFIDMRGKLGDELTICGDIFYDYAKMYQSLIGYDFILNNSTPSFLYIKQNVSHFEELFIKKFGKEQFQYLKYITASLLFSLLPLHNNKKCVDYYNLIEYII